MISISELTRIKKELPFFIKNVSVRLSKICRNKDLVMNREGGNNSLSTGYIEKRLRNSIANYNSLIPLLRPLALGNTKNNHIQFDFLQDLCNGLGLSTKIAILNGSPWGKIQSKIDEGISASLIEEIVKDLIAHVNIHGESNSHKEEVLKAFYSYVHFNLNFAHLVCEKIPFVIVANDHNPMLIGFSMAAKDKGIDRLYIQHASVTEFFPDLDFEVSVLGNFKSAEIYRRTPVFGKGNNKVLIVPRHPFNSSKNIDFRDDPYVDSTKKVIICLYLTALSIEENLFEAVKKISRNPFVSGFYIKPHPNKSYNEEISNFLEKYSEFLIDDSLGMPHVAIVGGSSTCIQLRASGVRVYQGFFLDKIPRDYYGFVKDGFCDEVDLQRLDSKFWDSWDVKAKEISKKLYVTEKDNKVVKKSIKVLGDFLLEKLSSLEKYKNNDVVINFSGFDEYLKNLESAVLANYKKKEFENYLSIIKGCDLGDLRDPIARIKFVDFLHKCRVAGVYDLMKMAGQNENCFELKSYFKYLHAFWVNAIVPDEEVLSDISLLKDQENSSVRKYSASSIFRYILEFKSSVFINKNVDFNFLIKNKILTVANADKLILASLCENDINSDLIDFYNKKYTDFDKEKLLWKLLWENSDRLLIEKYSKYYFSRRIDPSHLFEVERLASFLKKDVSSQLSHFYQEVNENIISNNIQNYLMMRVNDELRDKFFEKVAEFIVNKNSFSFIRLSDGEGYIFDGFYFDGNDSTNRELHWWGTGLSAALRSTIKEELSYAVKNADALGIPSIFRMWRDLSPKVERLDTSIQMRGMLSVLQGVNSLFESKSLRCQFALEEKSNQFLFSDVSKIRELINLAEGVVIISSVNKAVFSDIFKSNTIHCINIPTHARTKGSEGYSSSNKPLPFVYEDVKRELLNIVRPGYLVLVSAGVIGKIFIDISKRQGAVALDIGECADGYLRSANIG